MEISGKTVVVTGGASGIGKACAEMFASKGATAVIADLPTQDIAGAVDGITKAGGKAIGVPTNVTNEAEVEALMQKAVDETGRLDVLVACAGVLRDGLMLKVDKETGKVSKVMSLDNWNMVVGVNLTGVFLSLREAAKQMVNCGNGGVLIPISSTSRHGNMGQLNYSATKAAVATMVVVTSKELTRYGIRSAAIAPGFIGTPMVLKDMKQEALDKWKKMIPIGRIGEPSEIAHAAVFITENDMVTGVCYDVSGGIRI